MKYLAFVLLASLASADFVPYIDLCHATVAVPAQPSVFSCGYQIQSGDKHITGGFKGNWNDQWWDIDSLDSKASPSDPLQVCSTGRQYQQFVLEGTRPDLTFAVNFWLLPGLTPKGQTFVIHELWINGEQVAVPPMTDYGMFCNKYGLDKFRGPYK
ncbi:uncharacterized protein L969DRAFT_88424 [Mixia osmundae IAM 14324]|uniref:Uncharacterized protein n=1 Tax=Mixia osmundae (strain CBS 9802 / IAM 14324 / JCM 22182 / KY 12970) TaxID=764103 RepID=G7E6Y0_MIXOS|nr:uncharacterized protein L969DRAFT_88424 [Mixia osmundae IAM 14324]KEI39027.1 hypothetical protein L969DRAFT_88424 [Mixia osmundae IAM 14324]GAA98590.1 hypothetical protein E5Q_05277 [Mixia osmundae IAM 14324]